MRNTIIFLILLTYSVVSFAQENAALNLSKLEGIVSLRESGILQHFRSMGYSQTVFSEKNNLITYAFSKQEKKVISVTFNYVSKSKGGGLKWTRDSLTSALIMFDLTNIPIQVYNELRNKVIADSNYNNSQYVNSKDGFEKRIGNKDLVLFLPLKPLIKENKKLLIVTFQSVKHKLIQSPIISDVHEDKQVEDANLTTDSIPLLASSLDSGYKFSKYLPLTYYSPTQQFVFSLQEKSFVLEISPLLKLQEKTKFVCQINGNIILIEGVDTFLSFDELDGVLYLNDKNGNHIKLKQKRF